MKSFQILSTALAVLFAAIAGGHAAPLTEIRDAAQPQLTLGSDGRVWLVYGQPVEAVALAAHGRTQHQGHQPAARSGNVFVASSSDGGSTLSPPVNVSHLPQLMLGMRRGPRIAALRRQKRNRHRSRWTRIPRKNVTVAGPPLSGASATVVPPAKVFPAPVSLAKIIRAPVASARSPAKSVRRKPTSNTARRAPR